MREDTRTFIFAGATCLVVSLLLSVTASVLKPAQQANEAFDVKRNIVKAFGYGFEVNEKGKKIEWKRPRFEATFEKHVVEDKAGDLPIFTWTDEGADQASKYAFPISGKGLWSMLYGYLSLEADLETIAGVSFYKHGETPGLGAEIEKPWFLSQFAGKKLYAEGEPTEFLVSKPGMAEGDSAVDGISGATLTGKGVQILIQKDAAAYTEYFKSIRGN
jgi:Na+-transporting NADH:ubiquinone oxidoreductase subunit C